MLAKCVGQFECYFSTFRNISSLMFLLHFFISFFHKSFNSCLLLRLFFLFSFPLIPSLLFCALILYLLLTFLVFSPPYFLCLSLSLHLSFFFSSFLTSLHFISLYQFLSLLIPLFLRSFFLCSLYQTLFPSSSLLIFFIFLFSLVSFFL